MIDRSDPLEGRVSDLGLMVASTAIAVIRIYGHRSIAFQAVAHLFVGGLVGAAVVRPLGWRMYALLAGALSAIEAMCFAAGFVRG